MEFARTEILFWAGIVASVPMIPMVLSDLGKLRRARALYGGIPVSAALKTARFALRSQGWFELISPVLWGVGLYVFGQIFVPFPPTVFLPIVLWQLFLILRILLAPTVLLLGSSRWQTARLFTLIERGVYPYRVVVLLDPQSVDRARHSSIHWMGFEEGNLRQPADTDWRIAVDTIAGFAPLIVLDTRFVSPAVVTEAHRIFSTPELERKTVFLLEDDGSSPVLRQAGLEGRVPPQQTVKFEGVVACLRRMGPLRTTSPDDNPVLGPMIYKRHTTRLGKAMQAVGDTGIPLQKALSEILGRFGHTDQTDEVEAIIAQLNGGPNGGAMELIAGLSADIAVVEAFLEKWSVSPNRAERHLIGPMRGTYDALCRLQQTIDQMPPGLLATGKTTL